MKQKRDRYEMHKYWGKKPSNDLKELIEEFAQGYENPSEVVKMHYSSKERLHEAESAVLEDNVVAWVLEKASIVEKKVTFDELMGKS